MDDNTNNTAMITVLSMMSSRTRTGRSFGMLDASLSVSDGATIYPIRVLDKIPNTRR